MEIVAFSPVVVLLLDIQDCEMKFGSWTYSGEQVDLVHINQTNGSMPYHGNSSNTEFHSILLSI